jgi:hypothetical protein
MAAGLSGEDLASVFEAAIARLSVSGETCATR